MKKFLLCSLLIIQLAGAFAQKELYDIVKHTPPSGWKKDTSNSMLTYSKIDGGSWCQLAIYQSTTSKGSIEADSKSEWDKIVLSQRSITGKEEKTKPETANGWTVMSRSGVWQFNGTNVSSILTTYSNKKVCVSILCNATAKPYFEDRKKLVSSVVLNAVNNTVAQSNTVQETIAIQPSNTVQPSALNTLVGEWNENIFERSGAQFTAGYFQKQYTFKSDGTYQFLQKNWSAYVPGIIFVNETGKWTVSGNTLTITPIRSTSQEWSKAASGRSSEWGKLLKTKSRKLESNTYSFQTKYYSGSPSATLALLTNKSTEREPIPANAPSPFTIMYSLNTKSTLISFPPGANP